MARKLLAAIVAMPLLAASVHATDKPDKRAAAAALISNALKISDIRAPGSPPFELHATLTVPVRNRKAATGTYTLTWVSHDRWREEIHFIGYSRIRFGGMNKYWQVRSLNYELPPIYDFSEGFGFARDLQAALDGPYWSQKADGKIETKQRKLGKQRVTCVYLTNPDSRFTSEFCFDPGQGTLVRGGFPGFGVAEYSDFRAFQGKLSPATVRITSDGDTLLTFQLDRISALEIVDTSLFVSPAGSILFADCRVNGQGAEEPSTKTLPNYPVGDRAAHISGKVDVYAVVGSDGALHNIKILASPSSGLTDATLQALKGWRYKPASCSGQPEQSEIIITVIYNLGG
ncbi:MAG: energy transducer TonB [Candidatus Acidiferrales bacterium]